MDAVLQTSTFAFRLSDFVDVTTKLVTFDIGRSTRHAGLSLILQYLSKPQLSEGHVSELQWPYPHLNEYASSFADGDPVKAFTKH